MYFIINSVLFGGIVEVAEMTTSYPIVGVRPSKPLILNIFGIFETYRDI